MAVQNTYNQQSFKAMTISKTNNTESKKVSGLSENAQKYLEELQKKYGNINFIVQNYETDEEASRYLANVKGKGEYNCIITPALLEKMASDESVAAEYEGILASAGDKFDSIKEQLGDDAKYVKTYGLSINDKGEVSFYAIIRDTLAKFNETNEKLASNRSERKETERANIKPKEDSLIMVKANTIEELIEQIKKAIEDKTQEKSKDILEKAPDIKVWEKVGGKKDGFIDSDGKIKTSGINNIYSKR